MTYDVYKKNGSIPLSFIYFLMTFFISYSDAKNFFVDQLTKHNELRMTNCERVVYDL